MHVYDDVCTWCLSVNMICYCEMKKLYIITVESDETVGIIFF